MLGKQARQPSGVTTSMTKRSGGLSHDVLIPGQVIYSDQFSARVKGKDLPPLELVRNKNTQVGLSFMMQHLSMCVWNCKLVTLQLRR